MRHPAAAYGKPYRQAGSNDLWLTEGVEQVPVPLRGVRTHRREDDRADRIVTQVCEELGLRLFRRDVREQGAELREAEYLLDVRRREGERLPLTVRLPGDGDVRVTA